MRLRTESAPAGLPLALLVCSMCTTPTSAQTDPDRAEIRPEEAPSGEPAVDAREGPGAGPGPAAAPPAPTPPTTVAPSAPPEAGQPEPFAFRVRETLVFPELQVRMRGEERVHPFPASPAFEHTHFVTSRFRVGLRVEGAQFRIHIQAQEVRDFGTASPGTDAGPSFGVHQAYGEWRSGASFLRLGRQEIVYTDERMLGRLDWAMAARSFDAARGHFERRDYAVDGFLAIMAPQVVIDPATGAGSHGDMLGALQLTAHPDPAFGADLLFLYRRDRPTTMAPTRDRRITASSLRIAGAPTEGLRYVAEGMFEWGEVAGRNFVAYAAAADVFYTVQADFRPTFGVGAALGSGERAGKVGEFDNFYPTNHKFYGFADLFGLRNLVEGHVTMDVPVSDTGVTWYVHAHTFFLERPGQRWTNAVGAVVAPDAITAGTAPGDPWLGGELDFGANYRVNAWLTMQGGYGVFIPASGAADRGFDEANHWAWLAFHFQTPG